ncbi:MAG: helix-turn-helix domain-containing protein [Faecousia sp.]
MRLLIVDDSKAVVEGLLRQDWSSIGITQVIGVCSAAEARRVLAEHIVDVMLCDIEMPVEDGLSLVKWMRDQGMITKCIFLTAHAEFSYAQKSVALGVFDYVVQPAPYSEIRRAVERATEILQQEKHQVYLQQYGRITNWKSKQEAAGAIQRYLTGADISELEPYIRTGALPAEDKKVYLVYMQIQRWFSYEKWSDEPLSMMMDSAVGEVFSPNEQQFIVTMMGDDRFALLLWNPQAAVVQDRITHQLSFLYNVCRQQLKCTLSLYPTGPTHLADLQQAWKTLQQGQARNVEMRTGVQTEKGSPVIVRREMEADSVKTWQEALYDPSQEKLEQYIQKRVWQLCEVGMTEENAVAALNEEFLTVIHRITGNADEYWRKVLVDTRSYDIYRNATKSMQDLVELAKLAQQRFSRKEQERIDKIVETIIHYVDDHLDKEIHRSDLADYVYLNPDYLNRLFKKQTGKTLKEFIIAYKMNEAKKMLQVTRLPVSIIAAKVGYDNFSHFSYAYKKVIGQSPMETRNTATATEKEHS